MSASSRSARAPHSCIDDTCATCHMELTPPPAQFSFSGTFSAIAEARAVLEDHLKVDVAD